MTDIPIVRRAPPPRQLPRWVVGLIALCCAIEAALQLAAVLGHPAARHAAYMLGAFWSPLLHGGTGLYPGQPVTMFLSHGVLHSGLGHLAMNMVSLAVVARELHRLVGSGPMALIYLISQIAGAAMFGIMQPQSGPMIGASGAVFGVAGALVAYAGIVGHRRRRAMGQMWRSVALLLGLNVALTVLMPSIAWQAHLGGALAGAIIGGALAVRDAPPRR